MAGNSTRLADLAVTPEVSTAAIIHRCLERNAFVNSGIMARDRRLDEFLSSPVGGHTIAPRYLGPLVLEEPNIASDDPSQKSTPRKLAGGKCVAVRQSLSQSWSSMNLVASLAGLDPLGAVTNQMGDYWSGIMGRRLLSSLKGIVAADTAKKLTVDISGESGLAALFNGDAFIDCQATMGDMASSLTAIAVHSVVYATMLKQDLIDFIRDSEGRTEIATYMGKRVIVDDAMTSEAGEGVAKYYTYLFGAGAVALGVGSPKNSLAVEKNESAGNGAGEEVIYSRVEWVIHPQGFSFGKTTTPTIAELEAAANWEMKFERKRIPLACLISQG